MPTLKIDRDATLYPLETSGHQRLVEQIARRLLREGRLTAKKDEDYYQSLQG